MSFGKENCRGLFDGRSVPSATVRCRVLFDVSSFLDNIWFTCTRYVSSVEQDFDTESGQNLQLSCERRSVL